MRAPCPWLKRAAPRVAQSDLFNRGVNAVVSKGLNVVVGKDSNANAYMVGCPSNVLTSTWVARRSARGLRVS